MNTTATKSKSAGLRSNESMWWRAVESRDHAADGKFVYAVKTTGVYCRPSCGARLANRRNVRFYATPNEAERAGFRPCKRCRPSQASANEDHQRAVTRACRMIEEAASPPALGTLAAATGMSPAQFHRVFKASTGLTPKGYAAAQRSKRVRSNLSDNRTVTGALYAAGFNSSGRFYATAARDLGMTPTAFRAGGRGTTIQFAIGQCWLGSILVAATEKGICAIALGDDPSALLHDLQDQFPHAHFAGGDEKFGQWVAQVVGFVKRPAVGLDLPLDIQGTAFQQRVWQALTKIPCGQKTTYSEFARRLGIPNATRAVASAIAANKIAVAIPCHRVIRTDGSLSGYRWGVERKEQLLAREQRDR